MTTGSQWTKHRGLARLLAQEISAPGLDHQDLEQEALIALWKASKQWDPSRGVKFTTYAGLLIKRRLATVLKAALAGKHQVLNESVRVVPSKDSHETNLVDVVDTLEADHGRSTEDVVMDRDRLARITAAYSELTPRQLRAVIDHLEGRESPSKNKAHENALTLARVKLRAAA